MVIQRNYIIGIIDHDKIPEVNEVISSYSEVTMESSANLYYARQPVNLGEDVLDATFFQLEAENENSLDKKIEDLFRDLDKLTGDYVIKDEESGKLLSVVDHGGKLLVKFDKLKIIKKGTFKQIDDLKQFKSDFGYTRGFNPSFRPIEERPIENIDVNPEVIYAISDSSENLSKFTEELSKKVMEIDSNFEVEFIPFKLV